jgi:hypothetical protein
MTSQQAAVVGPSGVAVGNSPKFPSGAKNAVVIEFGIGSHEMNGPRLMMAAVAAIIIVSAQSKDCV